MLSLDNSIVRKIYATVMPLEESVCGGGGGGGGGRYSHHNTQVRS